MAAPAQISETRALPERGGGARRGLLALVIVVAGVLNVSAIAAAGTLGADRAAILALASLLVAAIGGVRLYNAARGNSGAGGLDAGLLAQALRTSIEGQFITGPRGNVVFANEASRTLLGWQAEGRAGNVDAAFEGAAGALDTVHRLHGRAICGRAASDQLTLPGGPRRGETFTLAVRPVAGHPGHLIWSLAEAATNSPGSGADVSALRTVLDLAPIGIFITGADGAFSFVNQTFADWLGQPAEDLIESGNLFDLAADDNALRGPDGESLLSSGIVQLRHDDGSVFSAGVTLAPEPLELEGRSERVGLLVKHNESGGLGDRRSGTNSSRFFDEAPIGIVIVDHDDCILESNASFAGLVGAEGSVRETPLHDYLSAADGSDVVARLAAARRGGGFAPEEVNITGPVPRTAQLYVRGVEVGAPSADLIIYLVDTTARKNLEEQFAQSQKMQAVGQLAGGVAHDFNNLLTAMIGFCDLLLLRHGAGDQSFADIMQIKQNANRAANLVRQLLAFSRQQTLQPKVLALTDVLAELSNLLRRLIGETIELRLMHNRDLSLVKVDQGQLEQVVINLVVNARDAMPEGGTLTIRTDNVTLDRPTRQRNETIPPGDFVLIEVSDTGFGIEQEHLDKIFEPFFTTKPVGAGTGLGLSTVYGIIKQTGGFIFVASAPGKGSTFKIYLPRHSEPEARIEAAGDGEVAAPRDLTGTGTILLVEDEAPVRQFAVRALASKGYHVLEAENGEVAMALLNSFEGEIDMLVTDVVMPNMDGPTLVKKARVERPGIKAVLISGYAEDVFRKSLGRETDVAFLAKPFSLKELLGTVKANLEDA